MAVPVNHPDHQPRFAFGANWARFLRTVDEERVAAATASLEDWLGQGALAGRRFLDVGSGSGLFSLAAQRLQADVVSFDFDADSVACTQELRQRYAASSSRWQIEQGSVLDAAFLESLEKFDVVYSWGVLHHTGSMWNAMDLASQRVAPGGALWIALYNDQGRISMHWHDIKRLYQRLPQWLRPAYVAAVGGVYFGGKLAGRLLSALLSLMFLRSPRAELQRISHDAAKSDARGMHRWYDLVDWVGGYPFEVARPEDVIAFHRRRGFSLEKLTTCGGGLGCNQYLFRRRAD